MTENQTESIAVSPNVALVRAIVAARKAVKGTLFKAGAKTEGGGGNYRYIGHEHVVEHVRDAMLAQGLLCVQTGLSFMGAENTKSGACWRWSASHALTHVDGGSMILNTEGMTAQTDKAAFIASTACDRTCLQRLMGIAGTSDEDPEHNSNNREDKPQATSQQRVQEMADKRQHRQTGTSDRQALIAKHIAALPSMVDKQGLVEWAGWLVAGDDGNDGPQLRTIPNSEKKEAWGAYGRRCAKLGIDPATTTADYQTEARRLQGVV